MGYKDGYASGYYGGPERNEWVPYYYPARSGEYYPRETPARDYEPTAKAVRRVDSRPHFIVSPDRHPSIAGHRYGESLRSGKYEERETDDRRNIFTGERCSLSRRPATTRRERMEFDVGTFGGDVHSRLRGPGNVDSYGESHRRHKAYEPQFEVERRDSATSYHSSRRPSAFEEGSIGGSGRHDRRPSYHEVAPSLRPGNSHSALREVAYADASYGTGSEYSKGTRTLRRSNASRRVERISRRQN